MQTTIIIQRLLLQVFHGNSGKNDIVKHNLKEIARARFIRFQPTDYSTYKALRVEVFGILKPEGILLPTILLSAFIWSYSKVITWMHYMY